MTKVYVLWDRENYGDPQVVAICRNLEAAMKGSGVTGWEEEERNEDAMWLRAWIAEGPHGYRHIEEHEVQGVSE